MTQPTEGNINTLKNRAKKAQGKSSAGWRALGVAMMIFGALLTTLGVAVIVTSLAATSTGIFSPLGSIGAPIGAGVTAGGIGLFSAGLGLFVHGRQKGASKTMSGFAKECSRTQNANPLVNERTSLVS